VSITRPRHLETPLTYSNDIAAGVREGRHVS
jgi:hypothetical protein